MLGFFKTLMFFDWTQPIAAAMINPDGGEEIVVDSEDTFAAILELAESGVVVESYMSDPFNTNRTILFINRDDFKRLGLSQGDYTPRGK